MEKLKELQEKRLKLAAEIRGLAVRQDKWDDADRENWTKVNDDYNANQAELEKENECVKAAAEVREAVDKRLAEIKGHDAPNPRIGRDNAQLSDGPTRGNGPTEEQRALALQGWFRSAPYADPQDVGEVTDEHRVAAQACGIRMGSSGLTIRLDTDYRRVKRNIRNALSAVDGPSGGFTFGETFVGALEIAMKAFGAMFQVADIIRTATGEVMRWPTATDTTNTGRQIGESVAATKTDPTFAQKAWYAYKFSSDEILVPFELLRDSAFDLAGILAEMLGTRLGRIQNTKYTTGDGANTPSGIVTDAVAGITAASATALAFDELIDLEHKIDPAIRSLPGVGYMFHDGILQAIRKLKDGQSRYLWQAGANTGAPDTLNTYPYTVNQDMQATIATTTTTVLFGRFTNYKIRQVGSIRFYRLVERHRENDQDAFLAFVEGDGKLLDAGDNPVKKLVQG